MFRFEQGADISGLDVINFHCAFRIRVVMILNLVFTKHRLAGYTGSFAIEAVIDLRYILPAVCSLSDLERKST